MLYVGFCTSWLINWANKCLYVFSLRIAFSAAPGKESGERRQGSWSPTSIVQRLPVFLPKNQIFGNSQMVLSQNTTIRIRRFHLTFALGALILSLIPTFCFLRSILQEHLYHTVPGSSMMSGREQSNHAHMPESPVNRNHYGMPHEIGRASCRERV